MSKRVIVGVLWAAMLVAVAAAWTAGRHVGFRMSAAAPRDVSDSRGHRAPAMIDLYGNGVSPAVREFRLDRDGSAYEVHEPDVAISPLAPSS